MDWSRNRCLETAANVIQILPLRSGGEPLRQTAHVRALLIQNSRKQRHACTYLSVVNGSSLVEYLVLFALAESVIASLDLEVGCVSCSHLLHVCLGINNVS